MIIWRCRDARVFELSLQFFHLFSQPIDLTMGFVSREVKLGTGPKAFILYLMARDRLHPGFCRAVLLHRKPLLEQL